MIHVKLPHLALNTVSLVLIGSITIRHFINANLTQPDFGRNQVERTWD